MFYRTKIAIKAVVEADKEASNELKESVYRTLDSVDVHIDFDDIVELAAEYMVKNGFDPTKQVNGPSEAMQNIQNFTTSDGWKMVYQKIKDLH